MPLIVQKFGGTSVADAERIARCARRVITIRDGVVTGDEPVTDRRLVEAGEYAREVAV